MKVCSKCKRTKDFAAFTKDPRYSDGHASYCRACHSAYSRARKYGVTEQDLATLLDAQDHTCATCDSPLELGDRATHVDHCHATGAIRGILCRACNTTLGQVQEDPQRLRALAYYIEHHKEAA